MVNKTAYSPSPVPQRSLDNVPIYWEAGKLWEKFVRETQIDPIPFGLAQKEVKRLHSKRLLPAIGGLTVTLLLGECYYIFDENKWLTKNTRRPGEKQSYCRAQFGRIY